MGQSTTNRGNRKNLRRRWMISNIYKYRQFLETVNVAGFFVDPNFKIKIINEPACCLVNKSRQQLEGVFCFEGLWNRSAPCHECPARQAIDSLAKIEKIWY